MKELNVNILDVYSHYSCYIDFNINKKTNVNYVEQYNKAFDGCDSLVDYANQIGVMVGEYPFLREIEKKIVKLINYAIYEFLDVNLKITSFCSEKSLLGLEEIIEEKCVGDNIQLIDKFYNITLNNIKNMLGEINDVWCKDVIDKNKKTLYYYKYTLKHTVINCGYDFGDDFTSFYTLSRDVNKIIPLIIEKIYSDEELKSCYERLNMVRLSRFEYNRDTAYGYLIPRADDTLDFI